MISKIGDAPPPAKMGSDAHAPVFYVWVGDGKKTFCHNVDLGKIVELGETVSGWLDTPAGACPNVQHPEGAAPSDGRSRPVDRHGGPDATGVALA